MTPEELDQLEREAKEDQKFYWGLRKDGGESVLPGEVERRCETILALIKEVRSLKCSLEFATKNWVLAKEHLQLANAVIAKSESLIRAKDEALKNFCEWFQRMESDHWEKTSKSFEDACKNWDSLLREPFDVTQMREALALTLEEERPLSEQTREAVLKGIQEAKEGKFAPDPRGEEK